jgi:glycosyltransferase involved in cell wall biosynthesis
VPRVLFVYSRPSSFVSIDRDALAESFEVREWQQAGAAVNLLRLAREVRRSDIVFGWFASWHTFWPLTLAWLLRRPSVLVTGGYDTARMPEIGYGLQYRRLLGPISRWVMRRATRLVTNSHYAAGEVRAIPGMDSAQVTVVYHGIPDPFGALPGKPPEPLALTVGIVDERNLDRKGLQPFVAAAALLPGVRFVLVGRWDGAAVERLRAAGGPNVTLTGWVEEAELREWYRRATVYVQPSLHEGFGMSVAEAMLAGCVPVVTAAGALPEVVDAAGVLIDSAAPRDVAAGVERALAMDDEARRRARERVIERFPLAQRGEALRRVVSETLAAGGRS